MKKLTTRHWTIILLLASAAVLIGWDIFVAANPQPGDTISEIVLDWSRRVSLVPAAFGVLMGHLFWPRKGGTFRLEGIVLAAIFFGTRDLCAWVWDDVTGTTRFWLHTVWLPVVPLALGVPLGHWCWPQRPPPED